jgi:hypothetical protein
LTQKIPQPGEDAAEVVSDGGEYGIGSVSGATFWLAAAEVTLGLHLTDHGLDGGPASQLAFDDTEDAALLAGDEDATRILRVMAAVPVCTENLIRVDDVMESPKLAE